MPQNKPVVSFSSYSIPGHDTIFHFIEKNTAFSTW